VIILILPYTHIFPKCSLRKLGWNGPNGDHVAINSVDKADVILQPQEFQGADGNQQVLVLEMHVAFRNTTLLRVAYTITLAGQNPGPISRIEPIENTVRPNP
jgi:hypothetical protein